MPLQTEQESLPSYERPPVGETVLGVQFNPLPGFNNAHLGAFWMTLDRARWPTVSHAPSLPPQFERFSEAAQWGKGIEFQLTQDPDCRLQIKNKDGDRMVQVQNGRLHFNWLKDAKKDYPRYESIRAEFLGIQDQFLAFLSQEKLGDPKPNQWEVTYVNEIPQGTVWNSPKDWGFFRPLAPVPSLENLILGESFSGQWHFVIPEQKGRLHILWQHGVDRGEKHSVRLTLTARGPVGEDSGSARTTVEGLNLGRRTIVRAFEQLMSSEANQFWGLKNAND